MTGRDGAATPNPWRGIFRVEEAVQQRISEAVAKHGPSRTPLNKEMDPREKLVILVEEVGEVAKALTYDNGDPEELKTELEQVIAVAMMWRASL